MGCSEVRSEFTRPIYPWRNLAGARWKPSLYYLGQYSQYIWQVSFLTLYPTENIEINSKLESDTDKFQYNNVNRDHPKAFFGKWKHNVALVYNDDFANDCLGAIIEKKDYHSDDYQYYAADNLLIDTTVPCKFSAVLVRHVLG